VGDGDADGGDDRADTARAREGSEHSLDRAGSAGVTGDGGEVREFGRDGAGVPADDAALSEAGGLPGDAGAPAGGERDAAAAGPAGLPRGVRGAEGSRLHGRLRCCGFRFIRPLVPGLARPFVPISARPPEPGPSPAGGVVLVRWASPTLERVLPDLRTRLALAMLREWLDPDRVLRARRTTIARSVADNANGNQPHSGPFVDALVVGLREAAAHARALHRGHVDFAELQAEVAVEIDLMTSRIDALAGLERRIEALYAELHPAELLRTIPGIGQHIAPVIAGILHDPKRFRSERHLRGFCGLFPKRADSGGVERPGQRIAQGGNDRIKRALVLAADAARRTDPQLAETYWRLMTTKGHHHKQALCAVANRLVNRIRSVLLSQRPYVLRDLDGTEITVAQARAIVAQRYTVPTVVRASRRASRSAPPT
jgi:transposase